MIDQWGAESHWDVMERLALCNSGEGTERKTEKDDRARESLMRVFEK